MKICILNPSYEDTDSPTEDYDSDCYPALYLDSHTCVTVDIQKSTAEQQIHQLVQDGFEVFINLCDGAYDEERPGIEVVRALERWGVPFTGADSAFYEPSRAEVKAVCHKVGVKTPAHVMASGPEGVDHALSSLSFPMIVKHPNSYGSIGLTRDSRVETPEQLASQVKRMISVYDRALVEEFIEGREFTVLVAENPDDPHNPTAYLPVEFRFPPGETFKHFDMKWIDYDKMSCVPCTDPELTARLQDSSKKLFMGLGGVSYARCDLRLHPSGELYMLEINPNCGIFYPPTDPGSADFILLNDPAGHRGFLEQILRAAFKRSNHRSV